MGRAGAAVQGGGSERVADLRGEGASSPGCADGVMGGYMSAFIKLHTCDVCSLSYPCRLRKASPDTLSYCVKIQVATRTLPASSVCVHSAAAGSSASCSRTPVPLQSSRGRGLVCLPHPDAPGPTTRHTGRLFPSVFGAVFSSFPNMLRARLRQNR